MKLNEDKLDPAIRRWILKETEAKRTVVIRFAFSKVPDQAAEALGKAGMMVQSCGPGVVIAASERGSVIKASNMPWVIKIEPPQQLDMKSRLRMT